MALILGPTGSYCYYLLLMWGGYIGVAALSVLEGWRVAMALACAPWALCLAREYSAGKRHELPQRTAQHNLRMLYAYTRAALHDQCQGGLPSHPRCRILTLL